MLNPGDLIGQVPGQRIAADPCSQRRQERRSAAVLQLEREPGVQGGCREHQAGNAGRIFPAGGRGQLLRGRQMERSEVSIITVAASTLLSNAVTAGTSKTVAACCAIRSGRSVRECMLSGS